MRFHESCSRRIFSSTKSILPRNNKFSRKLSITQWLHAFYANFVLTMRDMMNRLDLVRPRFVFYARRGKISTLSRLYEKKIPWVRYERIKLTIITTRNLLK